MGTTTTKTTTAPNAMMRAMTQATKHAMPTLKLAGLTLGVTVLGVVAGAGLMHPAFTGTLRTVVGGSVVALLLVASLGVWLRGVLLARRARGGRAGRPGSAASPTIALRGRSASRTPKAVHALAERGAAPIEIARKTGLPLDAVSMLLELQPAR